MSTNTSARPAQDRPVPGRARASRTSSPPPRRRRTVVVAVVVVVVLAVLFDIYRAAADRTTRDGTTAATAYDVGPPGPGEQAPGFTLPTTSDGGQVDLADYRGQTVLLYFQEGLMCQPCWEQLKDLERASAAVEAAGVDAILSVTNDPAELLTQKVADEGISTPVAADTDLAVSRQYSTNQYGMMGDSRNGHSFVLVGATGDIQWRADYGGAPDYAMYVPVEQLMADLRAGRQGV